MNVVPISATSNQNEWKIKLDYTDENVTFFIFVY